MPAYNPPPQVLFSPVTNYYQGKAIRAQQEAAEQDAEIKDLQISMMRDELENAPSERERAEKMWDMQYRGAEAQLEGALLENGEKTMQFMATSLSALTSQATEDAISGDVEVALDRFNAGIQAAKSSFPAPIAEKVKSGAGEDGVYDAQELANLKMALAPWWARDPSDRSPRSVLVDGQPAEVFWDKAGNMYYEDGRPVLGQVTPFATNEQGVVGTAMTGPQAGGLARDFVQNAAGAAESANMGIDLLKNAFNNPTSLGVPGSIMRWGGGLLEGAKSLADAFDFSYAVGTTKEDLLLQETGTALDYDNFDYSSIDLDNLGLKGAAATQFLAGVYSIAFASAVAVQGTRPTDKDIQQFIDQIGGRSSSPTAFRHTIFQFMTQLDYRLESLATSYGLKETPEYKNAYIDNWKPKFREFLETYGETSGLMEEGLFLKNHDTGEVGIFNKINNEWEYF